MTGPALELALMQALDRWGIHVDSTRKEWHVWNGEREFLYVPGSTYAVLMADGCRVSCYLGAKSPNDLALFFAARSAVRIAA